MAIAQKLPNNSTQGLPLPTHNPIYKSAKTRFVNELKASTVVDSLFVLSYKDARISSNAGRYLRVELKDRTGTISGYQFDRQSFADVPPVDSVVRVKGQIEKRNGKQRIKITEISAFADYNPADFIAQSIRSAFEMREEFSRVLASVERKAYIQLAKKIFGSKEVFERFLEAPARADGLGACRGGALEQSLKLARVVDTLCQIYPHANRDELIIASLTHLIGAVDAFDFDTSIKKTKVGKKLHPVYLSGLKLQHVQTLVNSNGNEAILSLHELYASAFNEDYSIQVERKAARIELVIFSQALRLLEHCEEADSSQASQLLAGY